MDSNELSQAVNDTLSQLDFGDLSDLSVFGGASFWTVLGQILSGEYFKQHPDILGGIWGIFGSVVLAVLPMVVLVVAIAILCGFLGTAKNGGVSRLVFFVAYAAVVLIVMGSVSDLIQMVGKTLNILKTQVDLVFPIILTLMAAGGASTSANLYQPAVAVLSSVMMQIFTYVVMPLFVVSLAFSVVSHLAPRSRLDKFVSFFNALFKWIVGICFTVFLSFLAIQGITAGSFDSISIRATKMTMSGYVPIIGSYMSQGFDLIMASAVLIKNAVGLSGVLLLLGVVLAPIVKIVVFSLALKLAAAVTQPIGDARISNFLTALNKSFGMLVACLLGVAFMYLIILALLIMTGNVI
ncbi:MAG: stage III sporulation protein AE [Clostridia bacterium]|nr:stage III sporulation protein AE [Clostridia bacterium]